MRFLFEIDAKNYTGYSIDDYRLSVRSIIIKDKKLALIHSKKYNYYLFPGGGVEKGESLTSALIRETNEETGLKVITSSIQEFGHVRIIQKSIFFENGRLIYDNYYYLVEVEEGLDLQNLTDYEKMQEYVLEYVKPLDAYLANRQAIEKGVLKFQLESENRIIELLKLEGLIDILI